MADFETAFEKTLAIEGGYSNDPNDPGGETYKGIARSRNPSWTGWAVIDAAKQPGQSAEALEAILNKDADLQGMVRSFYKQRYWDVFWGDQVPNQDVAEELFDTGVNTGTGAAVEFLQEGLNLLNRNQADYADVAQDGSFGKNTMKALTEYLKKDNNDPSALLKIMNILQGMRYIEIMRKNPTQEKYARGWLKRVTIGA